MPRNNKHRNKAAGGNQRSPIHSLGMVDDFKALKAAVPSNAAVPSKAAWGMPPPTTAGALQHMPPTATATATASVPLTFAQMSAKVDQMSNELRTHLAEILDLKNQVRLLEESSSKAAGGMSASKAAGGMSASPLPVASKAAGGMSAHHVTATSPFARTGLTTAYRSTFTSDHNCTRCGGRHDDSSARRTTSGKLKDNMHPACRREALDEYARNFWRRHKCLGKFSHVCLFTYVLTGGLFTLTIPRPNGPGDQNAIDIAVGGHCDSDQGSTLRFVGGAGDEFVYSPNLIHTSKLAEEFILKKNVKELFLPENIADTALAYLRWFADFFVGSKKLEKCWTQEKIDKKLASTEILVGGALQEASITQMFWADVRGGLITVLGNVDPPHIMLERWEKVRAAYGIQ